MPVAFQLLHDFPLLQALPQEALLRLSTQMSVRSYSRREMVLSKDKLAQGLGFLVEGRLQGVDFTVDGRSVGLYFVEPGDYFGELAVIDGKFASEHVVAAVKSKVAFLENAPAQDLIFGNPEMAREVMVRLATRVRSVAAQRTLLALPNPFQRLCVQLLYLPNVKPDEESLVEAAPTHQELAIMINASRETVTRAFQLLVQNKVLTRDGNALRIMRPQFIRDIAEGRTLPPKA